MCRRHGGRSICAALSHDSVTIRLLLRKRGPLPLVSFRLRFLHHRCTSRSNCPQEQLYYWILATNNKYPGASLQKDSQLFMDAVFVKMFATALAFSQVASPDSVKTQFNPIDDQGQVVELLRGGCAQMRKAFDIEDVNLDDLIATAMDDADAIAGGHAALRGMDIKDLHTAYRQFCKNETVNQITRRSGDRHRIL